MNQEPNYDQVNKRLLSNISGKSLKFVLRSLNGALKPFIYTLLIKGVFILGVLLMVMLVYTAVFAVPKQIIEDNKIISLFNHGDEIISGWSEIEDIELYEKYLDLTSNWQDGLSEEQVNQAREYALPWSVLAAIDRVLGDPDINNEIKDTKIVVQPEKHYNLLKPTFTWRESTVTIKKEWKEKIGEGEEAKTVTKESTETKKIKVLVSASTFEANYEYEYETTTESTGSIGIDSTKTTVTKENISNINESGPYYEPLLNILASHGIDTTGTTNLEFIMELATLYDEDYKWTLEERWLNVNPGSNIVNDNDNNAGKGGNVSKYEGDLKAGYIWPLKVYTRISSYFGYRTHPITGEYKLHTGIDLSAPGGTPIYAANNGKVTSVTTNKAYGKMVIVDHGGGISTLYAHMSKTNAKSGQIVSAGDTIGFVGTTGYSTGNHLHFEVRKTEKGKVNYIDPLKYIKK